MNYVITTGWWCADEQLESRNQLIGDDLIREKDFHRCWYDAVRNTTSNASIYIIDSASPVKPVLNHGERLISLEKNFGHSTRCSYKLSGVTRAHILGMTLAQLNEYDYWVYIEQDALVYGERLIEKCIKSMSKPMAFGDGRGTPYPAQQSLMVIKTSYVSKFIGRLLKIKSSDKDISPEMKFCIASSPILSMFPEAIYKYIERRGFLNKALRIVMHGLIRGLRGYDYVPFGYGRNRPINFSDDFFYFQHGNKEEIDRFTSMLKEKPSLK